MRHLQHKRQFPSINRHRPHPRQLIDGFSPAGLFAADLDPTGTLHMERSNQRCLFRILGDDFPDILFTNNISSSVRVIYNTNGNFSQSTATDLLSTPIDGFSPVGLFAVDLDPTDSLTAADVVVADAADRVFLMRNEGGARAFSAQELPQGNGTSDAGVFWLGSLCHFLSRILSHFFSVSFSLYPFLR